MRHQAYHVALLITYACDVVDGSVRIGVFCSFFLFIHISEYYLLVSLQLRDLVFVEIIASLIVRNRNFQHLSFLRSNCEGRSGGFDLQPAPCADEAEWAVAQHSSR